MFKFNVTGCVLFVVIADYETWELSVDVMFNVSSPVEGWIELQVTQLGLHHRQRVSVDLISSTVHIVINVTQVRHSLL